MRKGLTALGLIGAVALLGGCTSGSGIFGRSGPDEFQVARRAPLVIPPDFALTPPKPGAPRPQEADSSGQALQALFGGPAQRSAGEAAIVGQAGRVGEPGVRSDVASTDNTVVDKGSTTREILAAPEGAGQDAQASVPQ
ncbi:DUF3035 domain-containing protein [Sphingomonas sp. 1P06PA]|uniref:DUF3035 domain-containing protein n=1 Tax=Sphingomonas sp. 1P06PA TaxID=554121 RepID=UPI0039A5D9DF